MPSGAGKETMALTYYSILAVDVSGYGGRTERGQAAVRAAMYRCVEAAARAAAIPWAECEQLDRGDGLYLLVPAYVSPPSLIDPFVAQLDGLLRQHNELSSAEAAVRMRVSVHAGLLHRDETGWVGTAINTAARLLDAPMLRTVLAAADRATTALIVSDEIHRSVVLHRHVGLDVATFREVRVVAKEVDTPAWIHVPGYAVPPGLDPPGDRAGPGSPGRSGNPDPNWPGAAPPPVRQVIGGNANVVGGNAGRDITITTTGGGT
jgi:hypothetical protein